jgi:acid stress-induced BolA-like protein IbaG/YrbA
MSLQILSSPSNPDEMVEKLSNAIAEALPGAQIEVQATGAGHFEIRVASQTFAEQTRVAQQQAVYAAIAHLMKGDAAPVHAIDTLETGVP